MSVGKHKKKIERENVKNVDFFECVSMSERFFLKKKKPNHMEGEKKSKGESHVSEHVSAYISNTLSYLNYYEN